MTAAKGSFGFASDCLNRPTVQTAVKGCPGDYYTGRGFFECKSKPLRPPTDTRRVTPRVVSGLGLRLIDRRKPQFFILGLRLFLRAAFCLDPPTTSVLNFFSRKEAKATSGRKGLKRIWPLP
jgi:hypothetical protein